MSDDPAVTVGVPPAGETDPSRGPGAAPSPEPSLPDWELSEVTARVVVLEEQLDATRQALSLLSVAVMVAAIVMAAYIVRSAKASA